MNFNFFDVPTTLQNNGDSKKWYEEYLEPVIIHTKKDLTYEKIKQQIKDKTGAVFQVKLKTGFDHGNQAYVIFKDPSALVKLRSAFPGKVHDFKYSMDNMNNCLHLSNLTPGVDANQLKQALSTFGQVKSLDMKIYKVEYFNKESALKCLMYGCFDIAFRDFCRPYLGVSLWMDKPSKNKRASSSGSNSPKSEKCEAFNNIPEQASSLVLEDFSDNNINNRMTLNRQYSQSAPSSRNNLDDNQVYAEYSATMFSFDKLDYDYKPQQKNLPLYQPQQQKSQQPTTKSTHTPFFEIKSEDLGCFFNFPSRN